MVLVEIRWKRGERLLVEKPDGWRNRSGVTVYTLDGKLPLELCHVVSPEWPLDLTQRWRRKPGDQFWVQHWTVVERTLHEIAQYARDRGGLDEAGRDCKEALESFFAFTGHYARGLVVTWEQLPERFRKGPEGNVLWFEERPEGGWTWKFEKVGPGHQPRVEGRIYLVLGAESRDRDRLLLVPGSPPIPYSFQKEGAAPRDSRGYPSESSDAEEKAVRVPERWLEDAARARERTRGELQDQTDFKVGVDLRVTWAAEQKKDQALVPLIAGCRERDREIVERFQTGDDGVLERLVKIDEWEVARWVPVVPNGKACGDMTWKEFCFRQAHIGLMGGHKNCRDTQRVLKRICWWQDGKT